MPKIGIGLGDRSSMLSKTRLFPQRKWSGYKSLADEQSMSLHNLPLPLWLELPEEPSALSWLLGAIWMAFDMLTMFLALAGDRGRLGLMFSFFTRPGIRQDLSRYAEGAFGAAENVSHRRRWEYRSTETRTILREQGGQICWRSGYIPLEWLGSGSFLHGHGSKIYPIIMLFRTSLIRKTALGQVGGRALCNGWASLYTN